MKFIYLLTTLDNETTTQKLVRSIIHKKLAACINIVGPVQSVYRSKNKVIHATEYKLFIKTTQILMPQLKKFILTYHPYKIPELSIIEAEQDSKEFTKWMETTLK